MPTPLEYNPLRASPEAHVSLLKMRIEQAQAEYDRAVERGIDAQVLIAKEELDKRQAEYDDFADGDGAEVPDTVHTVN